MLSLLLFCGCDQKAPSVEDAAYLASATYDASHIQPIDAPAWSKQSMIEHIVASLSDDTQADSVSVVASAPLEDTSHMRDVSLGKEIRFYTYDKGFIKPDDDIRAYPVFNKDEVALVCTVIFDDGNFLSDMLSEDYVTLFNNMQKINAIEFWLIFNESDGLYAVTPDGNVYRDNYSYNESFTEKELSEREAAFKQKLRAIDLSVLHKNVLEKDIKLDIK
jgi:hypothetical protein